MNKDVQICAKMDEDMAEAIFAYAKKYDLNASQVIRRAVKMFLANLKECGDKEVV